jgi:hypothetical protein
MCETIFRVSLAWHAVWRSRYSRVAAYCSGEVKLSTCNVDVSVQAVSHFHKQSKYQRIYIRASLVVPYAADTVRLFYNTWHSRDESSRLNDAVQHRCMLVQARFEKRAFRVIVLIFLTFEYIHARGEDYMYRHFASAEKGKLMNTNVFTAGKSSLCRGHAQQIANTRLQVYTTVVHQKKKNDTLQKLSDSFGHRRRLWQTYQQHYNTRNIKEMPLTANGIWTNFKQFCNMYSGLALSAACMLFVIAS